MNKWHQILAHASHKTIAHLEDLVEEVKVTNKNNGQVSPTNYCETCALFKAHRIIFRKSKKYKSSDKLFYWVTYNLMQFNTTLNTDQWVSHFSCAVIDFNLVFTHSKKSEATQIIQTTFNIIETWYNRKVVFFWSDGEKSLSIKFSSFISGKSITYELSAPDTPAQNGNSEQKKCMLAMKTRAICIKTGLSTYLWNKIIKTAGYIAN